MPQVIVAIPTIEERGDLWEQTARIWQHSLWEGAILTIPSWRKGGWCAGLNEVWEQYPYPDVFLAASDDMQPEGEWLPHVLEHLGRGECPVPTVLDPRMTTIGGTQDSYWETEPYEGAPARMTNFPILAGAWLDAVFPLPENLHYFGDNEIGDRLKAAGVPLVACLDITIIHTADERGRGAGMGSEQDRMAYDRVIYRSLG